MCFAGLAIDQWTSRYVLFRCSGFVIPRCFTRWNTELVSIHSYREIKWDAVILMCQATSKVVRFGYKIRAQTLSECPHLFSDGLPHFKETGHLFIIFYSAQKQIFWAFDIPNNNVEIGKLDFGRNLPLGQVWGLIVQSIPIRLFVTKPDDGLKKWKTKEVMAWMTNKSNWLRQ